MFKMGLLMSTAMTAVALLLSGAEHGAYAQTGMHVPVRNANNRFLCTYGRFPVSAASNIDSSSYFDSVWTHVAVPVTGQGQTVRRIKVVEAAGRYASNSAFTVGIYSNAPSGFPGKPIAVGTGRAVGSSSSCGPVTVRIAPTNLKRKTTYWIEETTRTLHRCHADMRARGDADRRRFRPSACSGTSHSTWVSWEADPNTNRRAYVQKHRHVISFSGASSSYTSPWNVQTKGPYLKLK